MADDKAEDWTTTNPFALAAISQASEHRHIVAARDILDDRGVKLWAANLRVSPTLHQRLIARKLQHPLETSLRVEDGVSNDDLVQELDAFLAGGEFLAQLVEPVADAVRYGARHVHLAPAAQLLLTAAQQNDAGSYRHAVRGMAVAGALALRTRAPVTMVDHAYAAGLLHDLGELYINPSYNRADRRLEPAEFRHIVSHPLIGAMLLQRLADYPDAVCRAVREHHERLDGSGYPGALQQSEISPLGQLLAMVELLLGLSARGDSAAAAASFTLRFMPAEMNASWAGPVIRAAGAPAPASAGPSALDLLGSLQRMQVAIDELLQTASDLSTSRHGDVARVGARAQQRLGRLRLAGHDMGLWPGAAVDRPDERERIDLQLAARELHHRLRNLPRDCLWPETDAGLLDEPALASLWLQLEGHLIGMD
jgi:hypothetical protein